MYVPEPHEEEHFRLLQFLAHYPHDARRYHVYGHAVPNAEPFFTNSELSVALLVKSPFNSHKRVPELLRIEGQSVELLWVQPITTQEWAVKRERGINALLGLFAHHRLPFVLDAHRRSLV